MKLLLSIFLAASLCLPLTTQAAPLEVTVTPSTIETQSHQYYYYNFGSVRVNWSQYADIYLRNTGHEPLYVRGVYISGAAFWAWSQCPNYLYPGQSCLTRVEFRPWYEGYFSGALRFAFPNGSIVVELYGWGVRW
ncbi:Ig-like domain-containing protein [Bdellovibrio bacteriovorus]|uniref:HYDIN/VesB/CFA65-like Ig-like domain-containing protein n=1 Tax=Bdellovibrio bacteriovorus TaxID=959 RepID=A0A1Z3N7K4_BDEBC|nr:hypothetical protein [Bdellovibrio bacteriovorus]ASD63454.1 hypothetical protein B9G79_07660 [Bdellovibrio bacteriovorus]